MGPQDMLMAMLGQQANPALAQANAPQGTSQIMSPQNLLFALVGMGLNNLPRIINSFMDLSQAGQSNTQPQSGALATPPETAPSPAMGTGAPGMMEPMGLAGMEQGPQAPPMGALVKLALMQRAMQNR